MYRTFNIKNIPLLVYICKIHRSREVTTRLLYDKHLTGRNKYRIDGWLVKSVDGR